MTNDLTYTFTVDQSPAEAFAAICDVRGWWSGQIEGRTDELGAEWSYEVPDLHFSAFRITELEPDRSVAWLVTEARLAFTEDKEEWTGTTVRFDVTPTDGRHPGAVHPRGAGPAGRVLRRLPGRLGRVHHRQPAQPDRDRLRSAELLRGPRGGSRGGPQSA